MGKPAPRQTPMPPAPLAGAVRRYWSVLAARQVDGAAPAPAAIRQTASPSGGDAAPEQADTGLRRAVPLPLPSLEGSRAAPGDSVWASAPRERWWQSRIDGLRPTLARPAGWAGESIGERADGPDERPFAEVLAEVLRDQAEQYGVPLV